MNYDFFDVHIHCIGSERGGILIGLEGEPSYENTLNNSNLQKLIESRNDYYPAYYITKDFNEVPNETILKYHPRREKYSSAEVIDDLQTRACKLCIIDTLYSPMWQPIDYYQVVTEYPNIFFILAHMGGYDIYDFVKILEFNKNVYADFSLTQEYFGWCGDRTPLNMVVDMINYCLNKDKLRKKVLFGSDYPFYSQRTAMEEYIKFPNINDILIGNFLTLINQINR